jgi:hypothetical protein
LFVELIEIGCVNDSVMLFGGELPVEGSAAFMLINSLRGSTAVLKVSVTANINSLLKTGTLEGVCLSEEQCPLGS